MQYALTVANTTNHRDYGQDVEQSETTAMLLIRPTKTGFELSRVVQNRVQNEATGQYHTDGVRLSYQLQLQGKTLKEAIAKGRVSRPVGRRGGHPAMVEVTKNTIKYFGRSKTKENTACKQWVDVSIPIPLIGWKEVEAKDIFSLYSTLIGGANNSEVFR